ncbi:MAG: hypothetical protein R3233_06480 [Xanthomonadales bacterium]|nr:hypothetical protein [Xanthomonadales bacterium]
MVRGWLAGVLTLLAAAAAAYETDQFSNRAAPIEDATGVLNARVNSTLRTIAQNWDGPRDEARFVNAVFHEIGGHHWVDRLERWAMKSDQVQTLPTGRWDSVYHQVPFWSTRVASVFGVGPTIKLNGVLIGSDKIGHFLSQGRKFWFRWKRYDDEARAAERSAMTERQIFGRLTTGIYSNADLVANYEGYRFYRSLFEDGVVPGKPAILAWNGGHWVQQREFDWADHVNAYWDEALNINHYDRILYPKMREQLLDLCSEYHQAPALWTIDDEVALQRRYAHLQLEDTRELRLDQLCSAGNGAENGSSDRARDTRVAAGAPAPG